MNLSKSDYILGNFCSKALWLKKNKSELLPDYDNAQAESGYQVQNLAHQLFPDGVIVDAEPWEISQGAKLTESLAKKHDVLFEAVARLPWGAFCRTDVLRKNGAGWDLIEIKSTTSLKDEHVDDLAFQYFVFSNAGYKIKNCFILHLNKRYVRRKKLDVKKLFVMENITPEVLAKYDEVAEASARLFDLQKSKVEPQIFVDKNCLDCDFFPYCGKNIPEYSILNVFRADTIERVYQKNQSYDLSKLCAEDYSGKNYIDIQSWQEKSEYCDKKQIQEFLKQLVYPLYYLDYETIMPAIPMFENSSPYQQIPFQFSLHVQKTSGGDLQHVSFLHKEKSDPRRSLAETLVQSCGKKGSVIVYNEMFEKTRNAELAKLFPDLSRDILNINNRVVDQLPVFRNRALYHYSQHSSASIKKVLPAFTDLDYSELEVKNGEEAMTRYLAFLNGELSLEEEKILFYGLEKYCGQDTYAMVLLMKVLYEKAA